MNDINILRLGSSDYELWHCVSARSLRALWMLEELHLPCTLHMLPFPPRVHRRDFLGENPLGTVPLLVHGTERMTESAAICAYLAASHPEAQLQLLPHESGYGEYLNWLFMSDATLTFPLTLVLRYTYFEKPQQRLPQVAHDYARWHLARLRSVEAQLAKSSYLCGDRFTAADVAVGYALLLSEHLDLRPQWGPATQAYWSRLKERPSLQAALERERIAAIEQGVDPTPSPLLRI